MNKTIFAKPGTNEQFVDMREVAICPDGMIQMSGERINPEDIALPNGTWLKTSPCIHLCKQLDTFASEVRQRFISGTGNVIAEYQRAEIAALTYKAAGFEGEVPPPVQSHAQHYKVTPREAALTILAMSEVMNTALDNIRDARLGGKQALKALDANAPEAHFQQVYKHWHSILDAIKPPEN